MQTFCQNVHPWHKYFNISHENQSLGLKFQVSGREANLWYLPSIIKNYYMSSSLFLCDIAPFMASHIDNHGIQIISTFSKLSDTFQPSQ